MISDPSFAEGPSADEVAAYYDAWTDRYLKAFGDAIQAHRPARDEDFYSYLMRRAGLRDGQHALDAGCGVCGPSRFFARQLDLRIEALTVSQRQAEAARRKVAEDGLDDCIRVTLGDYHELPNLYPRETFDIVFYLESLSHSPRPREALAAAYEVLRPGGIVYIKDYFIRQVDDHREQARVLEVVERVDRTFATKTAWAVDVVGHLDAVGFLRLFAEAPRFQVDNGRWQRFERDNGIDLFAGGDSFDWSQWLELKYQKP